MYDEVQAESVEMRGRQRNLMKDFDHQMSAVLRKGWVDELGHLRALHQGYAMAMVGYIDLLTATPVYIAVRDEALARGVERADAIYLAEKAVREAHGSASLVSRANVGRGEIMKWLTIAYNGYWNHNYNKWRSELKLLGPPSGPPPTGRTLMAASPDEEPMGMAGDEDDASLSTGQKVAMGAAFLTAFIVASSLVHHAIRGKKEETLGGAIAAMTASQLAGAVPFANTIMYSVIHGRDPHVSPIDSVLDSAVQVLRDALTKKHVKHPVVDTLRAGAFVFGAPPTNQLIDTGSFAYDVLTGRKSDVSVGQWARGVLAIGDKGKRP
jgi:hypothetical protein